MVFWKQIRKWTFQTRNAEEIDGIKNTTGNTVYKKLLVLCLIKGRCTFATSDFPSENPRTQTRNFPYTNTLWAIKKTDTDTMNKLLTLLVFIYTISVFGQENEQKELSDFLPNGFVIFEKTFGDLNKDGSEDCVLIIKGTNKDNIVENQFNEKVDRNRRGIIILFKKNDHYELAIKNYDCFASENEDGGVYFPPEMSIEISKGNLYVHYSHGRYGYWQYTFRYQNSDFELIGYDESNGGAVIDSETSINFLTKKKQTKVNTNDSAEGGDEVFKETWDNIKVDRLVKLSEIKDFFELSMSKY